MFSGIVETIGIIIDCIEENGCKHFTIQSILPLPDLATGDSISVNGVCLTITKALNSAFNVTAVPETLRLTNIDLLNIHSKVNLERSISLSKRIGGHYVQGHIDNKGKILCISKDNGSDSTLVTIEVPTDIAKYIVKKGYVGIDGMSITVIDVCVNQFTVALIPHTQHVTIAEHYIIGQTVNIEVDIFGKYLEKYLGAHTNDNVH